jgi:aspartyl-tRNA(Asn)/glutamyl-tRNA(Gln) amidotransferase subunit C
MSSSIDKKELEHLAKLARIELDPKEEEKMLADFGAMLEHFKTLEEIPTANVAPMAGGSDLVNVFREDAVEDGAVSETGGPENTNQGAGTDAFPESKDGFNKVPAVFE